MDDMFRPLRRYADFSGRASRREYWLFMLFVVSLLFGLVLLGLLVALSLDAAWRPGARMGVAAIVPFATAGLLILALFVPILAVQSRRFHDQDLSGWFVLLNFIPYVGRLIVLVFMVRAGTDGENRFGPDPYAPDDHVAEIFA